VPDFWPRGLNPKFLDAETKEAIKLHEEIRQLTERVAKLESESREHLEYLDNKVSILEGNK